MSPIEERGFASFVYQMGLSWCKFNIEASFFSLLKVLSEIWLPLGLLVVWYSREIKEMREWSRGLQSSPSSATAADRPTESVLLGTQKWVCYIIAHRTLE